MASPFTGVVVLDDDLEMPHHVQIDDLDSPNWRVTFVAPGRAGWLPIEGDPVRVTLRTGPRAGEVADARFAGQIDYWLEGMSASAPTPRS